MTTPDHAALIQRFYAAFAVLDSETMQACYATDARFEDPVFDLAGREQIGAMWRMLCETLRDNGRDAWRLDTNALACEGNACRAHWEPHYRFRTTGRLVHNIVDATFTFKDGLIATHRDAFDFWRWSRQALGTLGVLLGWSPILRNKVRAMALANLAIFTQRRA